MITIIKFGGSVITDKNKPLSVNQKTIDSLSSSLREFSKSNELIVVHGGGSFGHPLAKKYSLKKGYVNEKSFEGFALTQDAMQRLNRIIVESLLKNGVPAVSYQSSASLILKDGKIREINIKPLRLLLGMGLVPVIYGDVVADTSKRRFGIASGDMIIAHLSQKLPVKQVFFISDVDGVYTSDPKKDKKAKHIPLINRHNYSEVQASLGGSGGVDVTGGMAHKIGEIITLSRKGIIIEVLDPKNMKNAVEGKAHNATVIRW